MSQVLDPDAWATNVSTLLPPLFPAEKGTGAHPMYLTVTDISLFDSWEDSNTSPHFLDEDTMAHRPHRRPKCEWLAFELWS